MRTVQACFMVPFWKRRVPVRLFREHASVSPSLNRPCPWTREDSHHLSYATAYHVVITSLEQLQGHSTYPASLRSNRKVHVTTIISLTTATRYPHRITPHRWCGSLSNGFNFREKHRGLIVLRFPLRPQCWGQVVGRPLQQHPVIPAIFSRSVLYVNLAPVQKNGPSIDTLYPA